MRFVAGNYNGKYQLFVQKSNNDAALNDIQTNIKDFKFHSDFSYFRIVATKTQTITFPSHNVVTVTSYSKKNTSSTAIPWLHTTGFSISMPSNVKNDDFIMVYDNSGYPVASSIPVQYNGDAQRVLTFVSSGGGVFIQSQAYTHTNSIPSINRTYTIYAYRIVDTLGTNPGVLFSAQAGRVTFGLGKFDSNTPFLYRTVSNFGVVLTKDRTVLLQRYLFASDIYRIRYSVNLVSHKFNFASCPYLPNPVIHRLIA